MMFHIFAFIHKRICDCQVKPQDNIGSICLPEAILDLEPGTLATVTGWGRLGAQEGAPHSASLQVSHHSSEQLHLFF